ncbi:MAG: response regulator [Planctomycetota bacterium]
MHQPHVIIVEDDAAASESIRCLLHAYQFSTTNYHSGEAFLGVDDRPECDCLLIDMQLPGMNGLQLQETIHAMGSATPAILISGHIDSSTRADASRLNVSAVLEKPVNPERLIREIKNAIEN